MQERQEKSAIVISQEREERISPRCPQIIIIRGLPGSGKTSLAHQLTREIGSDIVIVDPDSIETASSEYVEFVEQLVSEEPEIDSKIIPYRFLLNRATKALLEERVIIWNQPFSDLEGLDYTIKKLTKEMKNNGKNVTVLIVDIEISEEIAFTRNKDRILRGEHGPDKKTFLRFVHDFRFASNLGYNHLIVDGTATVDENARLLLQLFQEQ